nr:selenide water dikinase [uncultured bacterium]
MNAPAEIRLTQFSHGGGCGCKIAPGVLEQMLGKSTVASMLPKELLVGIETSDDAAVYQINETQAIVATTDFFMPIVDDPFDFGAIAATNAISDVYAMGAKPVFALALVAMPVNQLPMSVIRRILEGGESVCARAGIPIAGGHTIDSVEPIYGLVAIGLADPKKIKRNAAAKPGDRLILGKPLGVGIYSAALKKQILSDEHYRLFVAMTTKLNTPGARLSDIDGVHALTDVTGFGLLGHLLEICKGSRLGATIDFSRLPILPHALAIAADGTFTGASDRNWAGYGAMVRMGAGLSEVEQRLLTDPQTSGGLLVSCAPDAVAQVMEIFEDEGFYQATVIGEMLAGDARVTVL